MKRPIPADSDDEAPEEVPRRRPGREAEALRRRAGPPPEEEEEDEPEAAEEEEEAEEEGDDTFAALRDVPFAELQRLQGDGRGLVGRGAGVAAAAAAAAARRARAARANKNRPAEQSSRRPVQYVLPQLEGAAGVAPPRKAGRDPRFESLSGDLNEPAFRKRYAFVFEEQLPEERKRLKALLQVRPARALRARCVLRASRGPRGAQREKKPARREELKEKLVRVQQTLKRDGDARAQDKRVRTFMQRRHRPAHRSAHTASPRPQERERRQREKEAVKGGKKPFYVKKCAPPRVFVLFRAVMLTGFPCALQLWRRRRTC
jgi:hypothetical protein